MPLLTCTCLSARLSSGLSIEDPLSGSDDVGQVNSLQKHALPPDQPSHEPRPHLADLHTLQYLFPLPGKQDNTLVPVRSPLAGDSYPQNLLFVPRVYTEPFGRRTRTVRCGYLQQRVSLKAFYTAFRCARGGGVDGLECDCAGPSCTWGRR